MEAVIQNILKDLSNREDLLRLFREKLGFKSPAVSTIPFDVDEKSIKDAEIIAELGSVKIFYLHLQSSFDESFVSERQIRKIERETLTKLSGTNRRQNIFIFSDSSKTYWNFIYPIDYGRRLVLKRFTIRPDNRDKLRTPASQLAKLLIKSGEEDRIYKNLEETFSVEAVSEQFFKDYEETFNAVKDSLLKQSSEKKRIHRFVHQLLNRLMFLYFVQRRGVFGGNKNFLATFWNTYRNNFEGKNKFYDEWLKILFFEALNNKFIAPRNYFKTSEIDFNPILRITPHLNGGLFKEDPEIDFLDIKLNDVLFVKIFDFLESYNFTVRESTPLDEDLEIDPEMLGNIYEAMVNVAEISSGDERHKAGIFYTPRTEIEFMLRQSLVEFLFNKTKIDKFKLYQFIFFEIEEQKVPKFSQKEAGVLCDVLDKITIVDPACGSGHYLVIAVQILFDLKKKLWLQLGNSKKSFKGFEEKLKIIESSIFGVDVKRWAAEIAKLRLWLDLLVEAEERQLKAGGEALLPNLAFKVRVGDSLVQEIGGIFFRAKEIKEIPSSLISLKEQLIKIKKDYFYGEKRITETMVKSKEVQFFKALLDEKIKEIKGQIYQLEAPLRETFRRQLQLVRLGKKEAEQLKLELSKKEQEKINKLKEEMTHLEKEKQKITMRSEFAFWPIEFSEVFAEKDGFDIVVANPPYVRQELIADPQKEKSTVEEKRKYKQKLLKQIQLDWNDEKGSLIKISQRADLYVYFYLKGLQLLNPEGVMCYISSNSWLDVGYGAALQEILLRRVPILAIYDNQVKRSFKHADVNTVIVVLRAPKSKDWDTGIKDNKVKFVSFKKPFEEVIFTEILWQIENIKKERLSTKEFRIIQKTQEDLYAEGLEEEKIEAKKKVFGGTYVGNKWGGKYLRAPEIYWKILEKGKDKLVRLEDIAEIRRGFTTGANDFFYLPSKYFDLKEEENYYKLIPKQEGLPEDIKIEKEFLKPVIKSPRECKSILIKPEDLKHKVFMCHKSKEELKGTKALKYIEWGEGQKFKKRPTVKNRTRWWELPKLPTADILFNQVFNDRFIFPLNKNNLLVDHAYYYLISKKKNKELAIALNSTVGALMTEIYGRSGLGEGALQTYGPEMKPLLIVDSDCIKKQDIDKIEKISKREIKSVFEESGINPKKPIRKQEPKPLPDRKALDDIVFDALGLTKEERKEVYWAVCELVKNRLEKAKSL